MGTQKKEEVYLPCSLQGSVVWGGVSSGEAVLADGEEGKPEDGVPGAQTTEADTGVQPTQAAASGRQTVKGQQFLVPFFRSQLCHSLSVTSRGFESLWVFPYPENWDPLPQSVVNTSRVSARLSAHGEVRGPVRTGHALVWASSLVNVLSPSYFIGSPQGIYEAKC